MGPGAGSTLSRFCSGVWNLDMIGQISLPRLRFITQVSYCGGEGGDARDMKRGLQIFGGGIVILKRRGAY